MKQIPFIFVALLMVLEGCSSSERNVRKEISDRVDAIIKENASYSIGECIYSEENDSCFIFEGYIISSEGEKTKTEFLYRQYEGDGLLIGIKSVDFYGSLLRNNNSKVNTGDSSMDDMVNEAFASSGVGLSLTIYSDLKNGSLIDITDANSK